MLACFLMQVLVIFMIVTHSLFLVSCNGLQAPIKNKYKKMAHKEIIITSFHWKTQDLQTKIRRNVTLLSPKSASAKIPHSLPAKSAKKITLFTLSLQKNHTLYPLSLKKKKTAKNTLYPLSLQKYHIRFPLTLQKYHTLFLPSLKKYPTLFP